LENIIQLIPGPRPFKLILKVGKTPTETETETETETQAEVAVRTRDEGPMSGQLTATTKM